jgi:sarcosine oxidase
VPGLDADVVVVGAGVIGAATARALAGRGHRVRALERFAIGHTHGSSHGSSRIFRLSYPDERYVRLAQQSLADWRELESLCGDRLLVTTGSLDLGRYASTNARALRACGARHEVLDGAQAAERWPLSFEPHEPVLHQPDAGVILAPQAWQALLGDAVALGATLDEHTRVVSIADRGRSIVVDTDNGSVTARAAVVAAGAWAAPLLAGAGEELAVVPTRETVAHFPSDEPAMPCVIDDAPPSEEAGEGRAGELTYALGSPGIGVKVGLHHTGPVADPDEPGEPDARIVARAAAWVGRRLPTAGRDPALVETCLYTNTADEGFVLERRGRIVVASACSGHAFKFAPSVGRTVAALASEAL